MIAPIEDNLQHVRDDISAIAERHGRDASAVKLIAVSKTRSLEEVRHAISAGQMDFGENTVQDALTKIPHVAPGDACWHFIGHLQSNKCNQFAGHFQWLHSVDSLRLLNKLDAAVSKSGADPLNCLLQVNLSQEASKSGLHVDDVVPLVEQVQHAGLESIRLRGLMTIGVAADLEATRRCFAACRKLAEQVRGESGMPGFDQLSMGMSGDYAEAIAEGATMIRIGTAIFGARDYSL